MSVIQWRTKVAVVLAMAAGAGVFMFGRNLAVPASQNQASNGPIKAQGKDKKDLTNPEFYGVNECRDCHTKPGGTFPTDLATLTEITTWRTMDKHALAFAVLEGPRGQQIGRLLGINVAEDPKCLNCHATTSRPMREGKGYSLIDGVSCDGCHGPAQHWIIYHALKRDEWRAKTPQEKEDWGMFDVRNPVKRTQMCMSCHVGNTAEGKVLTHAMYAAGHPPLPSFETASFSKNLPQHWRDLKKVPFFNDDKTDEKIKKQNYGDDTAFQQTKLVMASSRESLRSMVALLSNRTTLDGTLPTKDNVWPPPWLRPYAKNAPRDRWPELPKAVKERTADELQGELKELWPEIAMAQSDCYACHHDLKSPGWRQKFRAYAGGKPGRPQIQPWPFALVSVALAGAAEETEWTAKHKKLTAIMDAQPFGTPTDVKTAVLDLEHFAAKMLQPTAIINRDTARQFLHKLLLRGSSAYLDYDSARQIAWATRMVMGDLYENHPKDSEIRALLGDLDNELNLTLESKARKKSTKERYSLTADLANLTKKDLDRKLKDKIFLAALKENSDRELSEVLRTLGDYDPEVFQRRMKALSKLIGAKE